MRIGARKRPFYRVVAVDERSKRTGAYIELLGTYNPLTEPKEINLKQDRIDHWVKQGAQFSNGYLRIIGKAPQKPPRKPKKERKKVAKKDEEKKEESVKSETIAEPTKAETKTTSQSPETEENTNKGTIPETHKTAQTEPEVETLAKENEPKEQSQPSNQNKPEKENKEEDGRTA